MVMKLNIRSLPVPEKPSPLKLCRIPHQHLLLLMLIKKKYIKPFLSEICTILKNKSPTA
jgi:hypothetical protein